MQKVLHIMSAYGGGIGSFLVNIIRSLETTNIINDIVSFTDYPESYRKDIESKGGKVFTIKQIRLKRLFANFREIRELILQGNYDVVYIHMTDIGAFYFSFWARTCGIKRIIVHSHQTNHDNNKGLFGKIKFSLYRYITISVASQLSSCSKMASEFRFGKKYVDRHSVMHIPNSINVQSYGFNITEKEKKEIRHSLGLEDGEILVGHVGRFERQKNHDFMLELMKYMKEQGIKHKWIFVGTGAYYDEFKAKVSDASLNDVALVLGRRNDVAQLFQAMDLSILPSFYEGLPTVAVECQAAGTPILLADTITPEVDMGLGLTHFLSLSDTLETWKDSIIALSKLPHVDEKKRIEHIEKRRFTSPKAAQLYACFLEGEISSYNFEDININIK